MLFIVSTGTCVGEGIQDARVNEDDGIIQLDIVGHLVPQTIPLPHDHSCPYDHIDQGNVCAYVYM